jgi:hypothetical protein
LAQALHQIANATLFMIWFWAKPMKTGKHSEHFWCVVVCVGGYVFVSLSWGLQKQTKTTHVQQTKRSGVRRGLQVHRINGKTARLDVPVWRAGNYLILVHDESTGEAPVKLERHVKVEPQVH